MLLFNIAIVLILSFFSLVNANVEKLIFLGPPPLQTPSDFPLLADISYLERLSPAASDVRRKLHSTFPHSPPLTEPSEAFILLADLKEGQRYEVRICWPATQPTNFDLILHDPASISSSPPIGAALSEYIASRAIGTTPREVSGVENSQSSLLLLQVKATADYFSSNATLMHEGLLVDVDIILDPYLLKIFPRSLLPTGIHILIIALLSWPIAGLIWRHLETVAGEMQGEEGNAVKAGKAD